MLDLAGPAGAFEAANDQLESPVYRVHILAADEGAVTNSLGMATAAASLDDAVLDTLVVVGGRIDPPLSAGTLSRIADASADAGALRAFARGHSPSPRLDYWTSVGRQRTGDMQRAFSETTRPSGLRQTVSSVGTATYGRRRVSRPASILRWL